MSRQEKSDLSLNTKQKIKPDISASVEELERNIKFVLSSFVDDVENIYKRDIFIKSYLETNPSQSDFKKKLDKIVYDEIFLEVKKLIEKSLKEHDKKFVVEAVRQPHTIKTTTHKRTLR